jgi:crotonobetainyl-CoA:carnitine CoA-transferase CaiB-like acyl-CoA transferase
MDVMVRPDVNGEFSNMLVPEVGAAVGAVLAERFAERTCSEWLADFAAAGVPSAAVSSRDEWIASDIVAANRARVDFDDPVLGPVVLPGVPVSLSVTDGGVRHLPGPDHVLSAAAVWADDTGGRAAPSAAATPPDSPPLPLAGVRIVDLCTFVAGPTANAILADHGADVVKVEPVTGDPYRVYSVSYVVVNQRKRALALDLRNPAGRDVLLRLVSKADALVDNLRPASLERLGLGDAALLAANPALVRGSVSAYGHDGSWADLPGFDPVMQALSGLVRAQGGDGDPVPTTAPLHDACTGAVAALGILGALFARERAGPQRATTSLAAVSTYLQSAELTTFRDSHPSATGGVDFPGPSATHRYYEAGGGWVALAADEHRTRLLEVLGHPEWDELADDALAKALAADLTMRDADAVVDELGAAGVPAARVLDRDGELHDPFLVENRFSHVVSEPSIGRVRVVRTFAEWRGTEPAPPRGGALLGAHTREVLEEAGLTSQEVDELVASGAATVADAAPFQP